MIGNASTWKKTIRRHPHALSIAMLALWLTQLSYWAAWEWSRKPVANPLHPLQTVALETAVHVEPPIHIDDLHGIPACPFTMQFPIGNVPDFDSELHQFDEPTAGTTSSIVDPTKADEDATSVSPLPNHTEILETLRYCGFMQTTLGIRIAFIEDKNAERMLRIQVGDSIEDWELTAIARDRIIFTIQNEPPFEIIRDFREPKSSPPAEPLPEPVITEQKSKPETPADTSEKEATDL